MLNFLNRIYNKFSGAMHSTSYRAENLAQQADMSAFYEVEFCFLFREAAEEKAQLDSFYLKRHTLTLDVKSLATLYLNNELSDERAHNIISDFSHAVFQAKYKKAVLISLREQGYEPLLAAAMHLQGNTGIESITRFLHDNPEAKKVNILFAINRNSKALNTFATISYFVLNSEVSESNIEEIKKVCFKEVV